MSAARDLSAESVTDTDRIHRCDTVPPPDGEADAYSAPTKVGPMARAFVEKLMAQAEGPTETPGSTSAPRTSDVRSLAPRPRAANEPPELEAPATTPASIPRLFEDGEDGDLLDPTSLFGLPQSGDTMLLDLSSFGCVIEELTRGGPTPSAPAVSFRVATRDVVPNVFIAALAADRASVKPSPLSRFSGAELGIGVIAFAACIGLAFYFFFFTTLASFTRM